MEAKIKALSRQKKYSDREIVQFLNAQEKSGLNQKDYCRKRGIKLSTFYYWKGRRLKAKEFESKISSSSDFVQISKIVPERQLPANYPEYELSFGNGNVLKITGCALSDLFSNIREASLC